MLEEKKEQQSKEAAEAGNTDLAAKQAVAKAVFGEKKGGRPPRKFKDRKDDKPQDEFEQRIIDLARVTRVMAGGKRMRFRACVAVGNKKGKVGIGLAKGADVTMAVNKAVTKAKKEIIEVPIAKETIPHAVKYKLGAAEIMFKPAAKGRGVIAGGAVRVVLELAGIKNVTSKILGTNNKVNNVKCVIAALSSLEKVEAKPGKKGNDKEVKEVKTDQKSDKN
jgi:small subunit ribosomal protein S5